MGYYITQTESNFKITNEQINKFADDLRNFYLFNEDEEHHLESFNFKIDWIKDSKLSNHQLIKLILIENCYEPTFSDLNIVGINFTGEKLHDQLDFFKAFAPYVSHGSFLQYSGEEGEMWRWLFKDGKVDEIYPEIIWEE